VASHALTRESFFVVIRAAMLDLNRDVNALSNFKQTTPEFLGRLKESGQPVVLTINGKAELLVPDSASYQKLKYSRLRRALTDDEVRNWIAQVVYHYEVSPC
jgi:hypothetical protein